jgi:N-acetylated-alpha-linked acidic dipeptidase
MQIATLRCTSRILCLAAVLAHPSHAQTILGFAAASTPKQVETEAQFKAIPTPAEARRQHRIFTAEPHPAGSDRNNELARYIASEWQKMSLRYRLRVEVDLDDR